MTMQANAVAVAVDDSIAASNVNQLVNSNEPEHAVLDEFGRDASERTVELATRDAEAVDQEVTAGKHQTYDDGLHYVITRGLAEIKRQRDAARVAAEKTLVKMKRDNYASLMKANPSLIANAEFVATMLRDLGVTQITK